MRFPLSSRSKAITPFIRVSDSPSARHEFPALRSNTREFFPAFSAFFEVFFSLNQIAFNENLAFISVPGWIVPRGIGSKGLSGEKHSKRLKESINCIDNLEGNQEYLEKNIGLFLLVFSRTFDIV